MPRSRVDGASLLAFVLLGACGPPPTSDRVITIRWTIDGLPAPTGCPAKALVELRLSQRGSPWFVTHSRCELGRHSTSTTIRGEVSFEASLLAHDGLYEFPHRPSGTLYVSTFDQTAFINFVTRAPTEPDGGVDAPDGAMGQDAVAVDALATDVTAHDAPADLSAEASGDAAADSAGTDVAPRPDGPSDRDAGDPSACALREMPGACTPGPGCEIIDVAISGDHNGVGPCAVFTGGSVRCWGRGLVRSYLGNGQYACAVPGLVRDLTGVESVHQGANFACVVRAGPPRATWCWGANGFRQYRPDAENRGSPTQTLLPTGTLSLGGESGFSISASGLVHAWGRNNVGQLGDGSVAMGVPDVGANVHEISMPGLRQVALSGLRGTTACGVFAAGDVRCWGHGAAYQFGSAVTPVNFATQSVTPVTVPGISGAREVRLSDRLVCALRSDDTAWCWGSGPDPRIRGAGTAPTQVLDRVRQIVVGPSVVCALRSDETVWCWGDATEVGNGGTALVVDPERVRGLSGVRRLYAGGGTRCAWMGGAELWCWGLASGTPVAAGQSLVPLRVTW